jgi:hypothetical protein
MDRKTFIVRVARGGLLGALALGSGILLARRQVTLQRECGWYLPCRDCSRLEHCTLPEAEEARSSQGREQTQDKP